MRARFFGRHEHTAGAARPARPTSRPVRPLAIVSRGLRAVCSGLVWADGIACRALKATGREIMRAFAAYAICTGHMDAIPNHTDDPAPDESAYRAGCKDARAEWEPIPPERTYASVHFLDRR